MGAADRVWTLAQIGDHLGLEVVGDGSVRIAGIASVLSAAEGDICFVAERRYLGQLRASRAGAVITRRDWLDACGGLPTLLADDPYLAYARLSRLLERPAAVAAGVHQAAVVDVSSRLGSEVTVGPHASIGAAAVIGDGSVIGAGCRIGAGVRIGAETVLMPNVTVCDDVTIGARCRVNAGAVLGSDGFGYACDRGQWQRIAHLGGLSIGDDVSIGANTTIDRGSIDDTVIGDGVIIDNLVQIAHNVQVGAHTAIAACVGIAGSARIGRGCMLGGGVGVVGHIEIGDGAQVTAMSIVTRSVGPGGTFSSGTATLSAPIWRRAAVRFGQLDRLFRRVAALEKRSRRQ